MDGWIRTQTTLPTGGVVVDTKIDDERGLRNQQPLRLEGGLWYVPDGTLYVYYCPTHWRLVRTEE